MRISRIIVTAVLSLVVIGTPACGNGTAGQFDGTVPSANELQKLQGTEPGKTLMGKYQYSAVSNFYLHDVEKGESTLIGAIYVACGKEKDLTKCGADLHNRGTNEKPNVYVVSGKVMVLEGGRPSEDDPGRYYLIVPEGYRNFSELTDDQQKQVLGIMPTVAKSLGDPDDSDMHTIQTETFGPIQAWVSAETPDIRP